MSKERLLRLAIIGSGLFVASCASRPVTEPASETLPSEQPLEQPSEQPSPRQSSIETPRGSTIFKLFDDFRITPYGEGCLDTGYLEDRGCEIAEIINIGSDAIIKLKNGPECLPEL